MDCLRPTSIVGWTARFRLPGGGEGIAHCSLFSSSLLRIGAHVTGERGSLRVFNPVAPQIYHRFQIDTPGLTKRWKFPRKATYTFQLEAFASAVLRGTPIYTPPADSLANIAGYRRGVRHGGSARARNNTRVVIRSGTDVFGARSSSWMPSGRLHRQSLAAAVGTGRLLLVSAPTAAMRSSQQLVFVVVSPDLRSEFQSQLVFVVSAPDRGCDGFGRRSHDRRIGTVHEIHA